MVKEVISIRASSLPSLWDCPSRWWAINIEKRKVPTSPKALLGTAIHAGTAAYDLAKLNGSFLPVSEAEGAAVDAIYHPKEEVCWDDKDFDSPKKVESVARALHRIYCDKFATEFRYVGVEVTVNELLLTDLGIRLTGTTDRVYMDGAGNYGIVDIKSGKQAVIKTLSGNYVAKTQGHSTQIGVYEIIAEFGAGVPINAPAGIIGLQTGTTSQGQRGAVGRIHDARGTLVGDVDGAPGLLEIASKVAHGEIPIWGNPKSMMCHERYCPNFKTCKWRK